jgi:resuscitation-promoting factor RpfB
MSPASPFPPGRRRALNLSRRVRGLAVVTLLAAAAVGLYGFSSVVEVAVDGEVHEVRTYADTVGDVLATLEVEVGAADVVSPPPDTSVEDGMAIEVDRAITVEVTIDGATARRITAPVETVGGVLREADMRGLVAAGAKVVPAVGASVDDGDVIDLTLPTTVWVVADGAQHELVTLAEDVAAALEDTGVSVGVDDLVTPPLDTPLVGATRITVQRVEVVEETEEVVLEHDRVERESDELRKGKTRVETEGRDGRRVDTYEVTLVDGEETERVLVDETVEREPRDEVVFVGTYEPPPPAPSPSPRPTASSSGSSSASSSEPAATSSRSRATSAPSSSSSASSSSSGSSSGSSPSSSSSSGSSSSSASSSSSSSSGSSPSGSSSGSSSAGSSSSGTSTSPNDPAGSAVWERLAQCESNGNWQHISGNGLYYGGLQFHPDTWRMVGGTGMPHEASKAEQIRRGRILQERLGWGQWPACSRLLGLR